MNTFITPWAENTRLGLDIQGDSYNRNAETEYRQIDIKTMKHCENCTTKVIIINYAQPTVPFSIHTWLYQRQKVRGKGQALRLGNEA